MKKSIDEATARKDWQDRAKDITLETLPEFLRELSQEYKHDYGTICVAIGAAAVAAAWAMERSPQGGITGFQAGAVTWEFLRGWNSSMIGDCGARIQKFDDLLYPQYADRFTSISSDTWKNLQEKAADNLKTGNRNAHPDVLEHWASIAEGIVPFGLRISEG